MCYQYNIFVNKVNFLFVSKATFFMFQTVHRQERERVREATRTRISSVIGYQTFVVTLQVLTSSSSPSLPITPAGVLDSSEDPPPQSVTGQPLDDAPAVVHLLHFCFHISSPSCLWSTMLLLSVWGPVDCNSADGVCVLVQHMPITVSWLCVDVVLHILLLALC